MDIPAQSCILLINQEQIMERWEENIQAVSLELNVLFAN